QKLLSRETKIRGFVNVVDSIFGSWSLSFSNKDRIEFVAHKLVGEGGKLDSKTWHRLYESVKSLGGEFTEFCKLEGVTIDPTYPNCS
ncbi:hypothetical protein ACFL05_00310, partial [Patescibacteria group bacterium]